MLVFPLVLDNEGTKNRKTFLHKRKPDFHRKDLSKSWIFSTLPQINIFIEEAGRTNAFRWMEEVTINQGHTNCHATIQQRWREENIISNENQIRPRIVSSFSLFNPHTFQLIASITNNWSKEMSIFYRFYSSKNNFSSVIILRKFIVDDCVRFKEAGDLFNKNMSNGLRIVFGSELGKETFGSRDFSDQN